jgi:hypothetical protein
MNNRGYSSSPLDVTAARVMRRLELDTAAFRKSVEKGPVNPFTLKPLEPGEVQLEVPAGATDYQVRKLSKALGVKIPEDLQLWLKLTNGPSGFYGVDTPNEIDDIFWRVQEYYPTWPSRGLIPVAHDDCGCIYAISLLYKSTLGSAVVFMDLAGDDSEPQYVVASNMINFVELRLLKDEEPRSAAYQSVSEWVDALKLYVLSKDPAIATVIGMPCLWKT